MPARKKPRRVFSPAELAHARMQLIEKKLGILPDEVHFDGFYYNGEKALRAIKKRRRKK